MNILNSLTLMNSLYVLESPGSLYYCELIVEMGLLNVLNFLNTSFVLFSEKMLQ